MASAEQQGYNGWTNFETWAVNIWISSEEGDYLHWQEVAEGCRDEAGSDNAEVVELLADKLRDEHFALGDEPYSAEYGLFCDITKGDLWNVNWQEVAAAILEE